MGGQRVERVEGEPEVSAGLVWKAAEMEQGRNQRPRRREARSGECRSLAEHRDRISALARAERSRLSREEGAEVCLSSHDVGWVWT